MTEVCSACLMSKPMPTHPNQANARKVAPPRVVPSLVNELGRLAAQQAAELAARAREQGEQAIYDGKSQAAAQIAAVGSAVRRAADKLYDQDSASLAEYVDGAADRVEAVARHIDEGGLADLAHDAEMLARRKPLLFLGGMFVAGLASARILRAMTLKPVADSAPAEAAADGQP